MFARLHEQPGVLVCWVPGGSDKQALLEEDPRWPTRIGSDVFTATRGRVGTNVTLDCRTRGRTGSGAATDAERTYDQQDRPRQYRQAEEVGRRERESDREQRQGGHRLRVDAPCSSGRHRALPSPGWPEPHQQ